MIYSYNAEFGEIFRQLSFFQPYRSKIFFTTQQTKYKYSFVFTAHKFGILLAYSYLCSHRTYKRYEETDIIIVCCLFRTDSQC